MGRIGHGYDVQLFESFEKLQFRSIQAKEIEKAETCKRDFLRRNKRHE